EPGDRGTARDHAARRREARHEHLLEASPVFDPRGSSPRARRPDVPSLLTRAARRRVASVRLPRKAASPGLRSGYRLGVTAPPDASQPPGAGLVGKRSCAYGCRQAERRASPQRSRRGWTLRRSRAVAAVDRLVHKPPLLPPRRPPLPGGLRLWCELGEPPGSPRPPSTGPP